MRVILDDGRGEPRRLDDQRWLAWQAWLAALLARHRVPVAVAAVVAVVAGGFVVVRIVTPPPLPRLVVTEDAEQPGVADPWTVGDDLRPRAPVRLFVSAVVARAESGDGAAEGVSVLGLVGPGIARNDLPPVDIPATGAPTRVAMQATVDCGAVPEVVPGDAYGLRVEVGRGTARRGGVAAAGKPGAVWGRAVQLACATWTARRTLTVTAATADVHPTLSRFRATLTVTNTGDRAASLVRAGDAFPDVLVDAALPVTVPAHGSASLTASVTWRNCARGAADPGVADVEPDLTSLIGVAATSGPVPAEQVPFPDIGEGTQPSGVVLSAPAAADLLAAVRAACGDVGTIVVLVADHGATFDRARGEVTVHGVADLPRGRVASVTLTPGVDVPDPRPPGPRPLDPAQTFLLATPSVGPLVPDATGQVQFTLRFRSVAAPASCVPAFGLPELTATLRVPMPGRPPGTVREVPYPVFPDLSQDPATQAWTCP